MVNHLRLPVGVLLIPVTMYLKLATKEDEGAVLRLCRLFYEDSPFSPKFAYSEEKVRDLLYQSLSLTPSPILFLLLVDDSIPVGLLVGYATKTPFSDDLVASELAWYIDPKHRGSRKAIELVYAYEEWARRIGCKHISMSLLTSSTDTSKLYDRLGYTKTEISYMKELI